MLARRPCERRTRPARPCKFPFAKVWEPLQGLHEESLEAFYCAFHPPATQAPRLGDLETNLAHAY
jgi:hypothetical protein